MARRMLNRFELPSPAKAFKGMMPAPGAIRWTRPAVTVPCPKDAGGPSRMLVLDWLRIATVELFNCTRFWPSRMLVEDCIRAAAMAGGRSAISDALSEFEMKLNPGTRLAAKA